MFKKFLLVITTIVVLFSFVTYQPKRVDAAAGVAAKVVAQQAIKAVTKTAVDSTVQRMLVKELLEEVTESYAKKQGYKLIESGGQKMYMKATYNETEKVLLKKQIDKVIDKEVYGNTPKFVKFLDWFVGVGAVIAVGQVLYATLTGEFQSYMSDIITEAMIDLGWLTPAQPKTTNPSSPVGSGAFDSSPTFNYSSAYSTDTLLNNIDISATHIYKVNANLTNFVLEFPIKLPQPQFIDGSIFYAELMPTSSYGFDSVPFIQNQKIPGFSNVNTGVRWNGANIMLHSGTAQVYLGGKFHKSITNNMTISQITDGLVTYPSFYNRHIVQHKQFIPESKTYVSRYIMQDTYLKKLPDIYIQLVHSAGTTFSNSTMQQFTTGVEVWDSPAAFPYQLKLGYFRDIDLALSEDMLPRPKLNSPDLVVPVVSKDNRVPIPNVSILPGGYTYDPTEQVIKDPNGQTVTDPEAIQLPTPDPVITETPEGEVEIDGTPTGVPVPPGGISPPTNGDGTGGGMETGDPTKINWAKLKAVPMILTKKFPFSLPWDAKRFMEGVFGEIPAAEEFSLRIDELMGIDFNLNITMPEYFDGWFAFARTATVILFDIGLIYALYRLLGGAS